MNPQYEFKGEVKCADFIGRDKVTNNYGFDAQGVERIIEKMLTMLQAGGAFTDSGQGVVQIEHAGETLRFNKKAAGILENSKNERAYLLALTIDREYQRWATLFVPLSGKLSVRQELDEIVSYREEIPPERGAELQQSAYKQLKSIDEARDSHDTFVILGEPGAGKTTTLRNIAFKEARKRLESGQGRIPLFVRLSEQREREPYAFLQEIWERRIGIPFEQARSQGMMLVLADGINEIPREKRAERLKSWKNFIEEQRGANEIIFTGREKDYTDESLALSRVLVEPLNEDQIQDFLQKRGAGDLAEVLADPASRLADLARNPLNLGILVWVYMNGGRNLQMLANRGLLFEKFSSRLMETEHQKNPGKLSVQTITNLFANLAYEMQRRASGTTFELEDAKNALPKEILDVDEMVLVNATDVFRFGRGATILDPATLPNVRFYHQVLQEYFAARELLRRFEKGEDLSAFWKAPRTKEEMPPANVSEWDPLPEPPTTGWEVTTILACGLSKDPAKLIAAILEHNPALAGRCLDEAGLPPLPSGEGWGEGGVRSKTQQSLLAALYNPAIHLRARLQAGFILGRIGDPRFTPQTINGVKVILPTLVNVPAGTYTIGSADDDPDADDDEKPQHTVDLPAFAIGKWSVTNAEFACFIEAGGYTNETYWHGDLAKRWLAGEDVSGGQFSSWLNAWKQLKQMDDVRKTLEASGNFRPNEVDYYEYIAGLTEDELKSEIGNQFSKKSRTQPEYWKDRERNNPSQPVVGITWFEARAYCAWLSEVADKAYRLPTEVEWEAAARGADSPLPEGEGLGVRVYPWGNDWDKEKANTLEGRVMKPSPVGAYAAASAEAPFGAEDQAGNVYDWTSSLNLPYPYQAEHSEQTESTEERIVRGGSWYNGRRYVRCAYRYRFLPGFFNGYIGFRVVSPAL